MLGLTAPAAGTFYLDLPEFPVIRSELDVPTAVIQPTPTATTIGLAVGRLLVGLWSDRVERRLPLITATSLPLRRGTVRQAAFPAQCPRRDPGVSSAGMVR